MNNLSYSWSSIGDYSENHETSIVLTPLFSLSSFTMMENSITISRREEDDPLFTEDASPLLDTTFQVTHSKNSKKLVNVGKWNAGVLSALSPVLCESFRNNVRDPEFYVLFPEHSAKVIRGLLQMLQGEPVLNFSQNEIRQMLELLRNLQIGGEFSHDLDDDGYDQDMDLYDEDYIDPRDYLADSFKDEDIPLDYLMDQDPANFKQEVVEDDGDDDEDGEWDSSWSTKKSPKKKPKRSPKKKVVEDPLKTPKNNDPNAEFECKTCDVTMTNEEDLITQ